MSGVAPTCCKRALSPFEPREGRRLTGPGDTKVQQTGRGDTAAVVVPTEGDIAEIPTTWSKTVHSSRTDQRNERRQSAQLAQVGGGTQPDEANGPKSGLVVSNELRQLPWPSRMR